MNRHCGRKSKAILTLDAAKPFGSGTCGGALPSWSTVQYYCKLIRRWSSSPRPLPPFASNNLPLGGDYCTSLLTIGPLLEYACCPSQGNMNDGDEVQVGERDCLRALGICRLMLATNYCNNNNACTILPVHSLVACSSCTVLYSNGTYHAIRINSVVAFVQSP